MTWTFHSGLGTLKYGALTGQVDVSRPEFGIHALRLHEASLSGHIGRLARDAESASSPPDWPGTLADAYVRGDDLVAAYQSTDDWPFAPQVYWRAEASDSNLEVLSSLSILVSVSTHLLDTFPRISATTQLTADEVLQVIPAVGGGEHHHSLTGRHETLTPSQSSAFCLVCRLPGGQASYVEFMPASDYRQLAVRHVAGGACESQWEMFSEFLEKGVIRRARLQSAFLPREHDVRLAANYCRAVSARPLPLTT